MPLSNSRQCDGALLFVVVVVAFNKHHTMKLIDSSRRIRETRGGHNRSMYAALAGIIYRFIELT